MTARDLDAFVPIGLFAGMIVAAAMRRRRAMRKTAR